MTLGRSGAPLDPHVDAIARSQRHRRLRHHGTSATRSRRDSSRSANPRNAGVTDMRHGNVLDEHWEGRDRFAHASDTRSPLPLPVGVDGYAIAGTLSTQVEGKLRGDGIVPVDSALGRHAKPELTLGYSDTQRWISPATGHLDLLHHPGVYARLRSWLSP